VGVTTRFCSDILVSVLVGRAMARTINRRIPTAEARVPSQFKSCGICGEQSGIGACILRALRFPLPILLPPNIPYSSIIRGWHNRPNSGRRTKCTQSHPTLRKKMLLSWECQVVTHLSSNPKVQCCGHKNCPLDPHCGQLNPFHTSHPLCFISFCILLPTFRKN
jgi:hypothetical protein